MVNSLITLCLVILLLVSAAAASGTKLYSISDHEGKFATSPAANDGICSSMVETQGYICHEHTVTTQDGYILSMQRIPNAGSGKPADKPPVLLQHGLLMDGISWLLNSPDESLAFILADKGYDVWIANTRGTKYSLGHTSLSPNDQAYWEWTWVELAAYDLTASVKFVHGQTGQKLHYVGHSLGTLIAFAAFSQDKLISIIRSAALLSPIAHLGQISSQLTRIVGDAFFAEDLYWLGIREFNPRGEAAAKLLEVICQQPGTNCSDLMSPFTGQNCCLNSSRTDVFLEHEPQSTATKNFIHLFQMIRTGTIAMYDYGNEDDNMNHYGQPTPPVYDMTKIPLDLPLFLSYGGNDLLSDVDDVKLLLDDLKDHESDKLVVQYIKDYAHLDFVYSVRANQDVYDPMMAFFRLHSD